MGNKGNSDFDLGEYSDVAGVENIEDSLAGQVPVLPSNAENLQKEAKEGKSEPVDLEADKPLSREIHESASDSGGSKPAAKSTSSSGAKSS